MNQDILNFAIKVVVDEKGKSKVLEYIDQLYLKNPKLAFKSITNIINLPYKILSKSDIKVIKTPQINLFELRIQSGSVTFVDFSLLSRIPILLSCTALPKRLKRLTLKILIMA